MIELIINLEHLMKMMASGVASAPHNRETRACPPGGDLRMGPSVPLREP